MADITKTNAVTNGSVTFTPTAGAASQTFVVSKDERTVLYVKNGSASGITATVKAGDGIASVMGDLAVAVAAGEEKIIGPLESARFGDKTTHKITVALSATASVTIGVIQL
jgi:hypothetical protein